MGKTAEAKTISQVITLSDSTTAADYNSASSDVAKTYNAGYGVSLGIFDTNTGTYSSGCTVTSSAARRGVSVTMKASVSAALASSATLKASSLDAATLGNAVTQAATALGPSVTPAV